VTDQSILDDRAVRAGLEALARATPAGSLLLLAQLRARPEVARLDKPRFDRAVMRVAAAGYVHLHRHESPASLSPADRDDLVHDVRSNVYYMGAGGLVTEDELKDAARRPLSAGSDMSQTALPEYHVQVPGASSRWDDLRGESLMVLRGREAIGPVRLHYHGYFGYPSICQVEIRGVRVLCTEIEENRGTSITNRAEHLAAGVVRALGLPVPSFQWIEQYAYKPLHLTLVRFPDGLPTDGRGVRPVWRHFEVTSVEEIWGGWLPPSFSSPALDVARTQLLQLLAARRPLSCGGRL
jgi:hypothetical protein